MRVIAALLLMLSYSMMSKSLLSRACRSSLVAGSKYQAGTMGFDSSMMKSWLSSGGVNSEDTVVSRCTQKIQDALNPTKLVVQAAHDDPNGSHISVEVVSSMFEGKRSVQRQRLVYQAIWDEMKDGGAVHAVDQIIAQTPEEAA